MAEDSRRVLRGRCTMCACVQYKRLNSDKCSECSHPPSRHLKLDHNSVSPTSPISPMPGQAFGFPAYQPVVQPAQPRAQQHFPTPSPVVPYIPPVVHHSANSAPFLNDCPAEGCRSKVHYGPELGPFDYCSPQCRDQHLLPQERERLMKDIDRNKEKMITYLPASSASNTFRRDSGSGVSQHSASGGLASSDSSPPDDGRKKKMITIEKKPRESLGIITAQFPNETGFRIVGVELQTPAHHELKEGNIKFLDIITQLNEDDIQSGKWFEQSTKDKTKPLLTIWRRNKSPVPKALMSKVKDRFLLATHVRLIPNPILFNIGNNFGFEPTQMKGTLNGILVGVRETADSSAHLSGVTLRDEVLMYSTMSSKTITEGKLPTSADALKSEFKTALNEGKNLILVLRRHSY